VEERFTRLLVPVDPNNIEATAQALYDAVQAQMAAADLRKRGCTRVWTPEELEKLAEGE